MSKQRRNLKMPTSSEAPVDYWLDGFVIFTMVLGSLVGGVACTSLIASSSHFQSATTAAPLFLAWITLIAAEAAISWAGFWPSISSCWSAYKAVTPRNLKWVFGATLLIALSATTCAVIQPRQFPIDVKWPLMDEHHWRIALMSAIVLIPPIIAVAAMWFTAIQAREVACEQEPSFSEVAEFVALKTRLQTLLWYIGVVIGGAVLSTGTLRQALVDAGYATEKTYPSTLVLAYGAFFTLLVIISYVPAYLLTQHAGRQLVERLIPPGTKTVIEWNEERDKLAAQLHLDLGVNDSLKNAIAILAPIVAGFVSTALPK